MRQRPEPATRVFWVLTAVGAAVMAWGIFGLVTNAGPAVTQIKLGRWLLWFVGALLVHDGLIAPLALATGRGLRTVRPIVLRTPLQVGAVLSGMVTLLAYPLLRGYGQTAQGGNTSILPSNYWSGWLTVMALLWLGVAGVAGWRLLRRRHSRQTAR
ncbi:MAG: hypothetical protein H0T98_11505 [Euzebyaceae bacterium]|nr:hypothetical protein [Euzebyaceae bacterium]